MELEKNLALARYDMMPVVKNPLPKKDELRKSEPEDQKKEKEKVTIAEIKQKKLTGPEIATNTVKVLFLGLPNHGKTSTINVLTKKFPVKKELSTMIFGSFAKEMIVSTDGIDFVEFSDINKQITFSTWDFAGNAYVVGFKLYLSTNSIVVLTFNLEEFSKDPIKQWNILDAWLSLIDSKIPVILLGTHTDTKPVTSKLINQINSTIETNKLAKYPNIRDFIKISNKKTNGKHVNLVIELMEVTKVQNLIGNNFQQIFISVKEYILTEKKVMIRFSDFKTTIATRFSITDASDIKALLDFLTQSSQILYFKESVDSEWLFTDAQWMMNMVAQPLSIKIKFTKADFIAMLKDSLTQDAALVILALLLRKDIITVVDTNLYTLSSQINFLLT